MNSALLLVPYGTLIPELRTIAYRTGPPSVIHTLSPDTIFRLDDYLTGEARGTGETAISDTEKEQLRMIYGDRPVDRELVTLCGTLRERGGSVYLGRVAPILYDLYRTVIPGYMGLVDTTRGIPELDKTEVIVVTRDLGILERTIEDGGQGIHYQSAYRLQRELELRGLFVPGRTSGHIEMSGG
ncbi:MAG: hypothetical protein ACLFR8_03245 [Alkalispirochaeta sp.]